MFKHIIVKTEVNQYSQHFTVDLKLIKRVVGYAELTKKDIVLEIGAGTGNLTKELLKKSKNVIAYEIDTAFTKKLESLKSKNLDIKYTDFVTSRLPKFDKIVANIPYNASEPILTKLMTHNFKVAVLLVGKRFATILTTAKRGNRLSILAPAFFNVECLEDVPASAFDPAPSVSSTVIRMTPITLEDLNQNKRLYVTRELWQQRTKKTKNALREALIRYGAATGETITKRDIRTVIVNLALDENILGKNVGLLSGPELQKVIGKI